MRERTMQVPLAVLISIEQKPIKHSVSNSFFRFFFVQLRLQPDPVPFLQLQDGTSWSLLMAVLGLCSFVPDLDAIPHETHLDSILKQRNVKAKVVHTGDAAGEHSSGQVKWQLYRTSWKTMGWEGPGRGPLSLTEKADWGRQGRFSTAPGTPGIPLGPVTPGGPRSQNKQKKEW